MCTRGGGLYGQISVVIYFKRYDHVLKVAERRRRQRLLFTVTADVVRGGAVDVVSPANDRNMASMV